MLFRKTPIHSPCNLGSIFRFANFHGARPSRRNEEKREERGSIGLEIDWSTDSTIYDAFLQSVHARRCNNESGGSRRDAYAKLISRHYGTDVPKYIFQLISHIYTLFLYFIKFKYIFKTFLSFSLSILSIKINHFSNSFNLLKFTLLYFTFKFTVYHMVFFASLITIL